MNVTFLVQESIAFDHDGKRNPAKDDWDVESCGHIPDEMISDFAANRYPQAIQIRYIPTEEAFRLGLLSKL